MRLVLLRKLYDLLVCGSLIQIPPVCLVAALLATTIYSSDAAPVNETFNERVARLSSIVSSLSRQMMLQQLFVEERIRSDESSGIKQVRHNRDGTRPYHTETHTLFSANSIHDHANNIRTLGMGEVIGVLNGVEFRTRHNDYRLYMPSSTSVYHKTDLIPFPEVPESVKNKTTVEDQVAEMLMYFKAFEKQRTKIRDYRPYFKPVLCYLEGAWTADTKNIDDFHSDRHHLEAKNWFELQEKIRYTSITGVKNRFENFAFLPTTIMNVTDGETRFAQWNYRILCHPIEGYNLKKNKIFEVADDFAARMAYGRTLPDFEKSRAARFRMGHRNGRYRTVSYKYGLIDNLMYQIPGKDNYPANINDTSFGNLAKTYAGNNILNAGRYHRLYKISKKDGSGLNKRYRGFSDSNLYVAYTTQPEVAPISTLDCEMTTSGEVCEEYIARVSYAIPLEIVYLTPLLSWNPYDLEHKGLPRTDAGKTVTADGRNGGFTPETAWNGTHDTLYYRTPAEFFHGTEVNSDPADTVEGVRSVLDKNGVPRNVSASGTRIFLPELPNLGNIRTRFPIMPVHGEGSSEWKELDAVKEILNNLESNLDMLHTIPVNMA